MASKRGVRRRECSHKRRYDSHAQAESAMYVVVRAGKKRGGYLHVYLCRFCRGWHFGHAPRRNNQGAR